MRNQQNVFVRTDDRKSEAAQHRVATGRTSYGAYRIILTWARDLTPRTACRILTRSRCDVTHLCTSKRMIVWGAVCGVGLLRCEFLRAAFAYHPLPDSL